MWRFRNLPIRQKLMLAMMLTSVITLVLLGPALFLAGYLQLRSLTIQDTAALADIVGRNCADMMATANMPAAEKALSNLEARTSVEDAFLYDSTGRLFARYTRRDLAPQPPPSIHDPGEIFTGDHLELYREIQRNRSPVGMICLRSNTQIVSARLENYAGVGAIVAGFCILASLIFALRLERTISGPIMDLARVARGVTEFKDFSLRAARRGNDEIGALTEAFNQMLVIIQERDSGSRVSQSRLERRVAERTGELRKVGEALRESEERLRVVFEEAMDGFLVADQETKQLKLFNPRVCQMLGYSADELAKLTVADIHPAEDLPRIMETFARQAAKEVAVASEVPVQRKDGSVFYVDIAAGPLMMSGRRCVLGIFRDITERKRAEKVLQRQLEVEKFVASVSSRLANTMLMEVDAAIQEILGSLGRLTRTDRCYFFSVSEDLAIADNTHEWCAPGVRSQMAELHNLPTAAFPWYLERLRRGDPLLLRRREDLPAEAVAERQLSEQGNTVSSALVPIRHTNRLIGFIGCETTRLERDWSDEDARLLQTIGELIVNTRERLRVGHALRESEARLQLALNAAQMGPWLWDIAAGEIVWSPQCLALFGLPAGTVMTHDRFLQAIHPDDRARVQTALREAIENHVDYAIEQRVLWPDGSVRWLASRGRCSYDDSGCPLCMTGVSYDITRRKQAEAALKALNESLEQRVAERTAALRHSEEQYRVLIETTNTGFVVLDAAGRVVDANAEYVRLTGHDRVEAICGRGVVEWTAPHDVDRNAAEVRKCAERGFIRNFEIDYVNQQGQITPIEINATVVGNGDGARILSLCRDITERRRAEEALFQNEEKFRRTAAHMQDALYSVDVETREFRYLSPAFEKMLGYTEADIRNMGGRAAFLKQVIEQRALDSGQQARRLEQLKLQPKEGVAFRDEEWWRCKDGSLKCIADRWVPVYESGRLVSTEGSLSDITARKHAEDELRQSEKQFRAVFETASVGIGQSDPQTGRLLQVNRKMCTITGYSEDELLALRVPDITHPDDRERDWVMFERVVRGQMPSYRVEKRYVRKDGTVAWVNVNMSVIRDAAGHPVRTLATIEDITERKRAEVALTESEQRYRSLVDNLNVGVYRNTPDADGRFLQANPALARMHGYDSVDELMMTRVMDLYDNPADRETLVVVLLKTGAVTNHEVRLKKKDGTIIFCAVTAKAHLGADGQMDWVDGIIEDITERKRLERQLLEVSEREQRRIGQDLHDGLCQHLAGVGYMSKALARKLDVAARAEAADARALADLIRQAIADARATASGLYPVKMETNGIMAALQSLAANVESLFRIQCVFQSDPPVLLADNNAAVHLYRIAQEAVNNALRHGKARHITITLAEAGRRVTLTVRDDGLGLPDPLPASRGIGLDIMHHRARMIRGTLDIRRAPQGGTILTCSFPLTDVT